MLRWFPGLSILPVIALLTAAHPLPESPDDLLLVGDSVTAGVYFLSIRDDSAHQAWSGQLMEYLGLPRESVRRPDFYPIDHLKLTEEGLGIGGLKYPWAALPAVRPRRPLFAADEERVRLAIPGQTLGEYLRQSSLNKGHKSAGWTFASLFLPKDLSAIETIEQWTKRPPWIVVFLGANDALASFGIVGGAEPPTPKQFHNDYDELVVRLMKRMPDNTDPAQLIVLTVPDVTKLPFIQPVRDGSRDEHGGLLPKGTMASAFLVPFRDRFEDAEAFTPDELQEIRQLVAGYSDAVRQIADERGATVVDMDDVLGELAVDPNFATANSDYFSPDLHHPAFRTHAAIARRVLETMGRVADLQLNELTALSEVAARGEVATTEGSRRLPTNFDFNDTQRRRVGAVLRPAMQGLRSGPLPPKTTYRLGVELGGQSGFERVGDATLSLLVGTESVGFPIGDWWQTRGGVQARATAVALGSDQAPAYFPKTSIEFRGGIAHERIGGWSWLRGTYGALYALEGGFGWFLRGEYRGVYIDASSRSWEPGRFEAGIRWGAHPGRVGRNGN